MKGFLADIEKLTGENDAFREVLHTGHHLQLVLMSLKPGEAIGAETHAGHNQFFRIERGRGSIAIDGLVRDVREGDAILVPAGALHNLTNTGDGPLRLYTIYGPPRHVNGLLQREKAEAEASDEVFDGVASE